MEISVGGKLILGKSNWPRVEIREESENGYTAIHTLTLTDASPTSNPGVYKYTLSEPLPISANNVISLHEPIDSALEVYSEQNSEMFPRSVYVQESGEVQGSKQANGDRDRPLLHIQTGQ